MGKLGGQFWRNAFSKVSGFVSLGLSPRFNQTFDASPFPPPGSGEEHAAIDRFLEAIDFESEKESIKPEHVEIVKNAFLALTEELGWTRVKAAFTELLDEKSGPKQYRKFGGIPNFYHDLRPMIGTLIRYRNGDFSADKIEPHGGNETMLVAQARHDSHEDHSKSPHEIYAVQEKALHHDPRYQDLDNPDTLSAFQMALREATFSTEIVKGLSSHTKPPSVGGYYPPPKRVEYFVDEHNQPDKDAFIRGTLDHFMTFFIKQNDSIENISTLFHVDGAPPTNNAQKWYDYVNGKISSYHDNYVQNEQGEPLSVFERALEKWPAFEKNIRELDAMMQLNAAIFKRVVVSYNSGLRSDDIDKQPLGDRLAPFIDHAKEICTTPPLAFKSLFIQVERLEDIAKDEINRGDMTMLNLLQDEIYPALASLLGEEKMRLTHVARSDRGAVWRASGENSLDDNAPAMA